MFSARADVQRNRLYLTMRGMLDLAHATEAVRRCVETARLLRPGFDVISDISEMKPASEEATTVFGQAQGQIAKLGARRVVRVIGNAKLAALQMSRTGREAQVSYQPHTVGTLAEAEALLQKP